MWGREECLHVQCPIYCHRPRKSTCHYQFRLNMCLCLGECGLPLFDSAWFGFIVDMRVWGSGPIPTLNTPLNPLMFSFSQATWHKDCSLFLLHWGKAELNAGLLCGEAETPFCCSLQFLQSAILYSTSSTVHATSLINQSNDNKRICFSKQIMTIHQMAECFFWSYEVPLLL